MEDNAILISVMRSLGATWRALRLYPPTSPMPIQASQGACNAVEEYIQAEPSLKLDVVRGGFVLRGLEGVLTAPGVPELADALGSHGVGEVHFIAPPLAEEVLALLAAAQLLPPDLQARGGMQAALNEAGVGAIKIIPVILSKVETPPEIPEDEADKFLAELAADPGRLAMWLRSLLAFDDEGLIEGILTLAAAAVDAPSFARTMAAAFLELDTEGKDRLLEVSMELEQLRPVMEGMLANLSCVELIAAIRGGRYGDNVMALSFALTRLPVGERFDELLREAEEALRASDIGETLVLFLGRMIGVRRAPGPEAALVDARAAYRAMLESTRLRPEHLAAVRNAANARQRLDRAGVTTMLYLLDTAADFHTFCRVLDMLSRSVPHLLEAGDAELAMAVVREISQRSATLSKPWPGLQARMEQATDVACGMDSMAALLAVFPAEEQAAEYAKELVTLGGEKAGRSLAAAAMASEADDAMAFAAIILGRRLPELLVLEAPKAEARHAARLAELFARDGGAWCMQALSQLASRSEDRVRSETARGIAAVGGQAAMNLMPRFLRDPSVSVAKVAARALVRTGAEGGIQLLSERLAELEGDKDLPIAQELIALLATIPSPAATAALRQVAERGSFLRKGRYSEMKRLAREALAARNAKGA